MKYSPVCFDLLIQNDIQKDTTSFRYIGGLARRKVQSADYWSSLLLKLQWQKLTFTETISENWLASQKLPNAQLWVDRDPARR
jgi:hypothetical protein